MKTHKNLVFFASFNFFMFFTSTWVAVKINAFLQKSSLSFYSNLPAFWPVLYYAAFAAFAALLGALVLTYTALTKKQAFAAAPLLCMLFLIADIYLYTSRPFDRTLFMFLHLGINFTLAAHALFLKKAL